MLQQILTSVALAAFAGIHDPSDLSIRIVPFDVFVTVNDTTIYHGPAVFVREQTVGAVAQTHVLVNTGSQLLDLPIEHQSSVEISTKAPSVAGVANFGLRLTNKGEQLYSGTPWMLHFQRATNSTDFQVLVADPAPIIFTVCDGDDISARSFVP